MFASVKNLLESVSRRDPYLTAFASLERLQDTR